MGEAIVNGTVKEALDYLRKNRSDPEGQFELSYTQWVVNRLLAAALPALKKLAGKEEIKKHLSPFCTMQEHITIGFYEETGHGKKEMRRYPDSVFFRQKAASRTAFRRQPSEPC